MMRKRRPAHMATAVAPTPARRPRATSRASAARIALVEDYIEPMKALGATAVPRGDWTYEIKFDGFRALALLRDGRVELWSRNKKPLTERFPEIAEALGKVKAARAVIDGEVVALDPAGRPRFQLLQRLDAEAGERPPLYFYVFDVLRIGDDSYLDQPIERRREALQKLLRSAPDRIRYSAPLSGDPDVLLAQMKEKGLEGLVAKAAGSVYEPGRRSGAWTKVRIASDQEFVIGGYTPPGGSRRYFGALLVGYYDQDGRLMYAGKVGTGFDAKKLASLHSRFQNYLVKDCPFENLPLPRKSRFGLGMTASEMRKVTWLKPELVGQIKFSEWTGEGLLRQPVFLGLREDKKARQVRREVSVAD